MTAVASMSFIFEHPDFLRAQAIAHNFRPHMHSTYSVVALESGVAELQSSRWNGIARAGDVFFFNPFEVHSGRSLGEPAAYKVLYLSERVLEECIGHGSAQHFLNIRTGLLPGGAETEALMDALSTGSRDSAPVKAALGAILQRCSFTHDAPDSTSTGLVRRALRWISENYVRNIRTGDVAKQIRVHKSHFIREFSRSIGITPETYIRQLRIAKAQELICAGGNLSDIAQSLGFCDQAHLSREFKKVFGVAPGTLSRDARASFFKLQDRTHH